MNIILNRKTNALGRQQAIVTLSERLPSHVCQTSPLLCDFEVTASGQYDLLELHIQGQISVICQRCLSSFDHAYMHSVRLAICYDEQLAEKMMAHYETVVADNFQVNLTDIVTDELYLSVPEKHEDFTACHGETIGFMV